MLPDKEPMCKESSKIKSPSRGMNERGRKKEQNILAGFLERDSNGCNCKRKKK